MTWLPSVAPAVLHLRLLAENQTPDFPDGSILAAVLSSAGTGTALIVVLVLTGWLWTKQAVKDRDAAAVAALTAAEKAADDRCAILSAERDRAIARAQEAERQRDDLIRASSEKMAPMLAQFSLMVSQFGTVIQERIPPKYLEGHERDPGGRGQW